MTKRWFALLGFVLLAAASSAAEPAASAPATTPAGFATEADRVSYSIGYQVGGDFQRQGWELNADVLVQGLRDALSQSEPRLSPDEMTATLVNLKKKLVADQQSARKQADAAFLAANAKKSGVTVLPSGVQYSVFQAGTGKIPTAQDSVAIHYKVTLADGTPIGSTEPGNPKIYPVAKAIPALREALLLMAEGARWQIVIPPGTTAEDGSAMNGAGIIIYELELVSVQPAT